MAYALRQGVSYCKVGERLLFLDLQADRYLCLSPSAQAAFIRLSRGQVSCPNDLENFLPSGLVVASTQADLMPCPRPPAATGSFVEAAAKGVSKVQLTLGLSRLAHAALSLRFAGLNATTSRLAARKRTTFCRQQFQPDPTGILWKTSASLEACDALLGSRDKCLPRSIAAAHRLLDHGLQPLLVLGVRLDPFHAHAWTQFGDRLVNERIEVTRSFTPILVV